MNDEELRKIGIEKPTRWICRKCWRIMPRTEAEKRSADQCAPGGTADWKCSSCGAVGEFASDSSPEWAEFANDLVHEAYSEALQQAGYEVLEYSAQCDHGDHGHCTGKNRITEEIPPHLDWFKRCFCECHRAMAPHMGNG